MSIRNKTASTPLPGRPNSTWQEFARFRSNLRLSRRHAYDASPNMFAARIVTGNSEKLILIAMRRGTHKPQLFAAHQSASIRQRQNRLRAWSGKVADETKRMRAAQVEDVDARIEMLVAAKKRSAAEPAVRHVKQSILQMHCATAVSEVWTECLFQD